MEEDNATMPQEQLYNSCDPNITGEGVEWAYSTCTGTKKALLVRCPLMLHQVSILTCDVSLQIGINYVGTQSELRGCVNDVLNLRKFITGKIALSCTEVMDR